jgi:hypothetical protein
VGGWLIGRSRCGRDGGDSCPREWRAHPWQSCLRGGSTSHWPLYWDATLRR